MPFDRKSYMKEYLKKYYKANKKTMDDRVRQWNKDHPEKIKEWAKRYREENKEQLSINRRTPKFRDQIKKHRQSSIKAFLHKKWYAIKKRSKRCERYSCEITIDDLLALWHDQNGRCAISGKKMEYLFGTPFTVSVDRIDSNIGYKKGNIQLLCQAVNYAKNSFTNEEFIHFWTRSRIRRDHPSLHPKPHRLE